MPYNQTTYYDHLSILIINSNGLIRRLYAPFRVTCIDPVDQLFNGVRVYVDAVFMDHKHLLVYQINGKAYSYKHFSIHINF